MIQSIYTNRITQQPAKPATVSKPSAQTTFRQELTSAQNAIPSRRSPVTRTHTPSAPSSTSGSTTTTSTSSSASTTGSTTTSSPSSANPADSSVTTTPGINNWQQWLSSFDPSTGAVNSPFANPFMTNPTETNPDGSITALNPSNWATEALAQQVASALGGQVTTTPPSFAGSPAGGFGYNQPQYFVSLPNGQTINPADLANLFTHGYPVAVLQQALPEFLGNTGPGNIPT
jgi:hypothetical protein